MHSYTNYDLTDMYVIQIYGAINGTVAQSMYREQFDGRQLLIGQTFERISAGFSACTLFKRYGYIYSSFKVPLHYSQIFLNALYMGSFPVFMKQENKVENQ